MKKISNILMKTDKVLKGKKGIIFDMDGTLIDSMKMWSTLDVEFMEGLGIKLDDNFHRAVSTMTLVMAAEYIHDKYKVEYTVDEIVNQFMSLAEEHYKYRLTLKSGVMELVETLHSKGVKMVVATANEYELSMAALERNNIYTYMDGLITCTMAGASKESPAVYLKACEMVGLKYEECAVFEDSLFAIKTAKRAGFDVVGVYDEAEKCNWKEICEITDCQVVFE